METQQWHRQQRQGERKISEVHEIGAETGLGNQGKAGLTKVNKRRLLEGLKLAGGGGLGSM